MFEIGRPIGGSSPGRRRFAQRRADRRFGRPIGVDQSLVVGPSASLTLSEKRLARYHEAFERERRKRRVNDDVTAGGRVACVIRSSVKSLANSSPDL